MRLSRQVEDLGHREQTHSKPFKTDIVPSTKNLHNIYQATVLLPPLVLSITCGITSFIFPTRSTGYCTPRKLTPT